MGNGCEQIGGACRSILVLLGVLGLLFSCLAVASCGFVETGRLRADAGADGGGLLDVANKAGIFLYENPENSCDSYDDYLDTDPVMKGVRAAGILAPTFAFLALSVQVTELMCCTMCCIENVISFLYLFAYVCQACTFSMLGSNICLARKFELSVGSAFAIISIILYFFCSLLICCSPKPKPCFCKKIEGGGFQEPARPSSSSQPPDVEQQQPIPAQTH